jgi:hypothetical protein
MKKLLLLFLISLPTLIMAQTLTGIASKWSDEFTEWDILTDDEDVVGELKMRWQLQGDWSEWDYRIEEEIGTIKLKWKNDPTQWEIRGYDEVVTAKMLWSNDIREWRITNNSISLTLKTRYGNLLDEWRVREDNYGRFEIYTHWEGDPREWDIVDELDEAMSLEMRMALVFISVFHSLPK